MLVDVIRVQLLEGFRLRLEFEDGIEGVVDVRQLLAFTGVFAPLQDPKEFASVRVNEELGTVCWPCGADLDPDVLYSLITGQPLPNFCEPALST